MVTGRGGSHGPMVSQAMYDYWATTPRARSPTQQPWVLQFMGHRRWSRRAPIRGPDCQPPWPSRAFAHYDGHHDIRSAREHARPRSAHPAAPESSRLGYPTVNPRPISRRDQGLPEHHTLRGHPTLGARKFPSPQRAWSPEEQRRSKRRSAP
jgi:hypothetical protein